MSAYADFFLPREVRWSWQRFGMHPDELELLMLDQCVPVQASGCWEWSGPRYDNGYGRLCFGFGQFYAHRVSQELWNGPLTRARPHALHSCDNPPCVNPDHLRAGTPQDNADDRAARGRARSRGGPAVPTNWVTEPERRGVGRRRRAPLEEVFALRADGLTQCQIGARLGISQTHVSAILAGKHGGEQFLREVAA